MEQALPMDQKVPTKFLLELKNLAEKRASLDYLTHMFSSHPETKGFLPNLGETVRHLTFGDPITAAKQLQKGTFLKNTFWNVGPNAGPISHGLHGALSYGLPLAMTAKQYFDTPAEQRKNITGQTIGGTVGGLIGGGISNRLGLLGSLAVAPAMQYAGTQLGKMFDPKDSTNLNPENIAQIKPHIYRNRFNTSSE